MQKFILSIYGLLLLLTPAYADNFNIRYMGAKADGKTLITPILQQAIDQCAASGGGRVTLDGGGQFLSGTIYMKSKVSLYIQGGTTLLASPRIEDYTKDTHKIMYKREAHMDRCLIYAEDAHQFSFEGTGTIDGNGHRENFSKQRPMLIRLKDCSQIRMNDLRLLNPAAWVSAWLYCDDIAISNITIQSRVNHNGDGLDFDGCTDVRVTNSSFDTSDDCICLQTSRPDRPCKDIVISNCTFVSKWAGIRIGLLSRGEISSVAVQNCTFRDISDAGLKIQQNEGGKLENMVFSNLVMKNVPRPIFMTFCQQRACVDAPQDQLDPLDKLGDMTFQQILVDNTALDQHSGFVFTGIPNHRIENITLQDVIFKTKGGGSKMDAKRKDIPEMTLEVMKHHWPEYSCFGGTLPASALFARHIQNLRVDNFTLVLSQKDYRKPLFKEDTPDLDVDIKVLAPF